MPIDTTRVKALWPWLAEARHFWLSCAVVGTALLVALRPNTPEPVIRLTGLVLQLLGIATVMWGISETRALFGHPSFVAQAKTWLRQFPLRKRRIVMAAGGTTLSAATATGRGYTTSSAGPNPSVGSRLDALEKNVSGIHDRISQTQKEMDDGFRKSADSLKHEAQTRESEDAAIRAKLEATGTGGVHISAIGALWLFVGVVLSTASPEIARCLS